MGIEMQIKHTKLQICVANVCLHGQNRSTYISTLCVFIYSSAAKAHEHKGKFFNHLKSIHEYVITLLTGTLIIRPSAGHLSDRTPLMWSEGLEVLVGDQWGAVQ